MGGSVEGRAEEHKDRGRMTVKQTNETVSALSHSCRWGSLRRTVQKTRNVCGFTSAGLWPRQDRPGGKKSTTAASIPWRCSSSGCTWVSSCSQRPTANLVGYHDERLVQRCSCVPTLQPSSPLPPHPHTPWWGALIARLWPLLSSGDKACLRQWMVVGARLALTAEEGGGLRVESQCWLIGAPRPRSSKLESSRISPGQSDVYVLVCVKGYGVTSTLLTKKQQ